MAYLMHCKACKAGDHDNCEHHTGSGYGVGICTCDHKSRLRRLLDRLRGK